MKRHREPCAMMDARGLKSKAGLPIGPVPSPKILPQPKLKAGKEDDPTWLIFFQMGWSWNHQLLVSVFCFFVLCGHLGWSKSHLVTRNIKDLNLPSVALLTHTWTWKHLWIWKWLLGWFFVLIPRWKTHRHTVIQYPFEKKKDNCFSNLCRKIRNRGFLVHHRAILMHHQAHQWWRWCPLKSCLWT